MSPQTPCLNSIVRSPGYLRLFALKTPPADGTLPLGRARSQRDSSVLSRRNRSLHDLLRSPASKPTDPCSGIHGVSPVRVTRRAPGSLRSKKPEPVHTPTSQRSRNPRMEVNAILATSLARKASRSRRKRRSTRLRDSLGNGPDSPARVESKSGSRAETDRVRVKRSITYADEGAPGPDVGGLPALVFCEGSCRLRREATSASRRGTPGRAPAGRAPAGARMPPSSQRRSGQAAASSRACCTAWMSRRILTLWATSTPPVSKAWFQVRPKSRRSTSVVAVKPARVPPQGSFASPS